MLLCLAFSSSGGPRGESQGLFSDDGAGRRLSEGDGLHAFLRNVLRRELTHCTGYTVDTRDVSTKDTLLIGYRPDPFPGPSSGPGSSLSKVLNTPASRARALGFVLLWLLLVTFQQLLAESQAEQVCCVCVLLAELQSCLCCSWGF